ncbi:PREDICTED: peptidyl-tRNA hydrolase ICT1, mitochondrial-like [Mandrillus leucophaeus]|uniref:peptidyl-tRNA hydrolase ICT1, mitochondrial-like n=1 Tax=Mandrillus leucophaeus TaxID=9568 RepID=UPI0005F52DD2|nr:PREDICTED: peptidyl-tRNA hydrolase ICT1, mitochondrial-like [Mandrillus leucophaeus]
MTGKGIFSRCGESSCRSSLQLKGELKWKTATGTERVTLDRKGFQVVEFPSILNIFISESCCLPPAKPYWEAKRPVWKSVLECELKRPRRALHKQKDGTEFKSIYSLDKLYPESQGSDTAWRVPDGAKQADSDIPLDGLTISYCWSSGPGGQNVNKVNSKVEVRFHLATADWIAEPVRQKIAIMHKNKINRLGELILTSESSRYQFRNLADCLQKVRDMGDII